MTEQHDHLQEKQKQTPKTKERQFKGLSLTERKQVRREKLIEAGIQAYGTHGFFAVTVKDICTEAKLTERYFYESFKKSEELFQTIFLKLIDELQQNVMQAIMQASADPKKMIDAGFTRLIGREKVYKLPEGEFNYGSGILNKQEVADLALKVAEQIRFIPSILVTESGGRTWRNLDLK